MNRVDLIKLIHIFGCDLGRHEAKHDWYIYSIIREIQDAPRPSRDQQSLCKEDRPGSRHFGGHASVDVGDA